MARAFLALGLLVASCNAGTTVWSGNFNSYPNASAFDNCKYSGSWADEVGEWQWYIHGAENTSYYLALDPSFKNPADTNETHGLRVRIDTTSTWNSQFERTDDPVVDSTAVSVPEKTTANLGTGNLLYHFSISHPSTNLPDPTLEHQICFFESHFTEMKYGVSPNGSQLTWMVQSVPQYEFDFSPGTWINIAYDIDASRFSASTVGLWASTGSNPLVKVVQNMAASTSTNSEDWHLGVLRLVNGGTPEDWYFSGVYIETAPITTSVGTGGGGTTSGTSTSSTTKSQSSTSSSSSSTSSAPQSTQTAYGQCGGTGYTGPTACSSGWSCVAVSPPYYYQCLQQ
ncbi:Carbohydrate-binding module family 1 protein [Mycena chlorophos]|uniref:Carbohydrate-binding module family 1 protein n=1 Tax=Mycena chlorophos TaxID=658473 RepID=A0A8H6RZI2_MYCCL|nr:Carbohydrate-binding module family 1 protein [Mycena chlorophos]